MWKLSFADDFGFSGCINEGDITSVTIKKGNNDGWNIGIVTYGYTSVYRSIALTKDFDVNRWVDGSDSNPQTGTLTSDISQGLIPDGMLTNLLAITLDLYSNLHTILYLALT